MSDADTADPRAGMFRALNWRIPGVRVSRATRGRATLAIVTVIDRTVLAQTAPIRAADVPIPFSSPFCLLSILSSFPPAPVRERAGAG